MTHVASSDTSAAPSSASMRVIDADFGDAALVSAGLSPLVHGLPASSILAIGVQIRALLAQGRTVVNLAMGDFDPRYFPIPTELAAAIERAIDAGATNYPPPLGVPALRQA